MHNERNLSSSELFLPREAPPTSTASDGRILSNDNKILVYSRDRDTCVLLKTIFELWGYQTHLSDSLNQAFTIIENFEPRLILLDSVLPFATHLENIRQIRLRDSSKQIAIVVISGFSQSQFKKLSLEAGANDFLVKPLDFDLLENYFKNFIETSSRKRIYKTG